MEALFAKRYDLICKIDFDFKHVSGEYWVIYINMAATANGLNTQVAKAEFRIYTRGKPVALKVGLMEDGSEGFNPSREPKTESENLMQLYAVCLLCWKNS